MFHVTNLRLARPARRIASRLAVTSDYAAWHGWQIKRTCLGGVRCRDPRFDARKSAAAGGRS